MTVFLLVSRKAAQFHLKLHSQPSGQPPPCRQNARRPRRPRQRPRRSSSATDRSSTSLMPGAHLASSPGLPLPHAHVHRFCSQACRASPRTGQRYSYVLRQRPRESAPRHRSRLPLPPTASPPRISFVRRRPATCYPDGQPLVTHALVAPAGATPYTHRANCVHDLWLDYCTHCSRICPPSSRHAHCLYRLLRCVRSSTCRPLRPARSGCPEQHTILLPAAHLALTYTPCPYTLRHPRGLVSPGFRTCPTSMLGRLCSPPLAEVRVGDPQAALVVLFNASRSDPALPDAQPATTRHPPAHHLCVRRHCPAARGPCVCTVLYVCVS